MKTFQPPFVISVDISALLLLVVFMTKTLNGR